MIVVATDYDSVTNSLALVAAQFVVNARTANASWPTGHLVPRPAANLPDRMEVHQFLNANPKAALIFFGHGYDDGHAHPGFHGQNQAPALDPAGAAILRNRLVVAVCCHSLNAMAMAALNHGATAVLGYDGLLNVHFPTLPGVDAAIRSCIASGLSALIQGKTVGEACEVTRNAFTRLETLLRRQNDLGYQVASSLVRFNAQRHGVCGRGTATL